VSIFLVVDELHEFLSMFGYSYDPSNYERKNVSRKVRGSFNEKNRKRIAKLYKKDWILYRFWTMNDEVRQNPIKKLLYTIQGYMG
jgi:hypothetical protein